MKQTAWMTFVVVLVLTLSLTRREGVDQKARNFINTLEARNHSVEANSQAMGIGERERLDEIRAAIVQGRVPSGTADEFLVK